MLWFLLHDGHRRRLQPQELNTDVTMALFREVLKDPEWRQARFAVSGVSGVEGRRRIVWLRGSPFFSENDGYTPS